MFPAVDFLYYRALQLAALTPKYAGLDPFHSRCVDYGSG